MLFHSQVFILLFLPATMALYFAVAGHAAWRQRVLIVASALFYAWWDVRFLPLLLGQILATWAVAALSDGGRNRGLVAFGIVLNLSSIFAFKYLDFVISNLQALGLTVPTAGLLLPIGISFFSFQLISYLVDLRRGDVPLYPLREFSLVVLLFPHLIAGPIVRHREIVPQFALDPRRGGLDQRLAIGFVIFALGLMQKVLLAERLGRVADPLFATATSAWLSFGEAWSAALAFSFQLLLDFSAYSTMAIGIALMLGFVFPENFNRPYLATDVRDFWRRWHMSLGAFLRDYVYIPLGGSRHGPGRFVLATLGTMTLCGIWHGAAWTFIAWGIMHGVGMVGVWAWQLLRRPLPLPMAWALTMLFVIAGWVVFRSVSFGAAAGMLGSMAGLNGFGGGLKAAPLLAVAGIVCLLLPPNYAIMAQARPSRLVAAASALATVACILIVGQDAPTNFIYFQF